MYLYKAYVYVCLHVYMCITVLYISYYTYYILYRVRETKEKCSSHMPFSGIKVRVWGE